MVWFKKHVSSEAVIAFADGWKWSVRERGGGG